MRRRRLPSWSAVRSWLLRRVSRRRGLRIRLNPPRMRHSQQRVPCDQRRGKAQYAARQADAAHSCAKRLQAKNAHDTLSERTAIRCHCKNRSAAPLFHQRKSPRIFDGIAAERHRHVVAAVLPLDPNLFVQPPDRGMIEEQRLHAHLKHIHKRIKPLNVRQFVGDHYLQLLFRQTRKRADRQKHDGAKPSDHRWRLKPLAFTISDSTIKAETILQRVANLAYPRAHQRRLPAPLTLDQQKSAGRTKAKERHAKKPSLHEPRKGIQRRRE